jgi:hypothetical protein
MSSAGGGTVSHTLVYLQFKNYNKLQKQVSIRKPELNGLKVYTWLV